MLKITIPEVILYDEDNNLFTTLNSYTLQLEHSLISVSKWESKWCKPFLSKTPMNRTETIDYIRCMNISQNANDIKYQFIPEESLNLIKDYIEAPMSATVLANDKEKVLNPGAITSELIYSWMVILTIPFECQKWHLNRLITFINLCQQNSKPKPKRKPGDILRSNAELNAKRLKELNTTG